MAEGKGAFARPLVLALVIGAILLAVLKLVFPHTSPRDFLTIVVLFALLLAYGIDYLLKRRARSKEP